MFRFVLAETEHQTAPAALGPLDSERKSERLVLVATDLVKAPGFPTHPANLEPTFHPAMGTDGGVCREVRWTWVMKGKAVSLVTWYDVLLFSVSSLSCLPSCHGITGLLTMA